jgi:hypothetical protein
MRRIIIIVVVAVLAIFILSRVACKGKKGNPATQKGKTTGAIKPKSQAEIKTEKAKAKREERLRKRELKRKQRAERLALSRMSRYGRYGYGYGYSRSRARRRGYTGSLWGARTGKKSNIALNKLTAIITANNKYFAIIDGRQYSIGDYVNGRKITNITNDRIVVDELGKMVEVKIGQSLNSSTIPRTSEQASPGILPKIGEIIKSNIPSVQVPMPNINESIAPSLIPSKIKEQIKF